MEEVLMKLRKRFFSGVVSLAMLFGVGGVLSNRVIADYAITAEAAEQVDVFCVDDFYYTVGKDNRVTLLRYNGSNSKVVFPNTIEGKKVTRISNQIFGEGGAMVKSITIPSNVEVIEPGAFIECVNLEDIRCNNTGNFSFVNGMLFCNRTQKAGFMAGPLGTMPKYDFDGNLNEAAEGYDTYISPDITVKKTLLFCSKYTIEISIPNGVDAIADYAFYNLYGFREKLTNIMLPTTIKYIGNYAFFNCESLSFMSSTETRDGETAFNIPYDTVYIGDMAFAGCRSMQSLNLPESLLGVGAGAFLTCGKLKTVYVPDSVQWLGPRSFGYIAWDLPYTALELTDAEVEKMAGFLLMSKTKMSENGDSTIAARYAEEQQLNYVDEEDYQNSDLDEDGNHTGNHQYISDDGEIISYDPVKTHDPDNDMDHDYAYNAYVAPTCTTPGAVAGICYCGHTYYYQFEALGHMYYPTVVAPTCTEEGYTAYICLRCGDVLIDDFHPKTDITDPTGHNYVDFVTEPTYKEGGYTEHICVNCGDSYIDSETDKLVCTEHDYVEEVLKPATCTSTGVKTYTCSKCDDSYTEEIPKTGHSYSWDITTPATCKQEGVKTYTCTACGDSYTEPIAKTAHTYVDTVYPPTATEQGYTEHVCSVCGESYRDNYTEKPDRPDGWDKGSDGKWYYYKNGAVLTGWKQIANKWYYFDVSGVMQTGWQQILKKWYYLGTNGAMVTDWQLIANKWYYFKSGVMQTGWQQISKKWYYFGTNGVMVTGWQQISKKWYFFGTNGVMVTGWQQIANKWYYFKSGAMQTGWQEISGKWYFFDGSGMMKTGWLKSSGKWYYFDSSGVMLAGTSKVISGRTYSFDANGVCTNP